VQQLGWQQLEGAASGVKPDTTGAPPPQLLQQT
jgi:hypothetical protein